MKSLFALACLFCLSTPLRADEGHPNIVFILVDDMGFGDPACFNPESKVRTPHLDRLAADGMRFTDAHAPGPLCHQSRYGLMTGRYPFRIDVNVWRTRPLIAEGEVTLPSLLRAAGYKTSMVGKWHLGFKEEAGYEKPLPGGPVDRGFDQFFGIRASTDIPPYFYIRNRQAVQPPTDQIEASQSEGWSPIQGAFWRAGGIAPDLALEDVLPTFTDEACSIIHQHGDRSEPLFLYLALPAPHTPWLPSDRFRGSSDVGLYGDFVTMVDAMIGRVMDAIKESGMEDDTLVVFTSDNGPVWYEEDQLRFGHDSVGGLRGMKADAWEGGHRMPMIVRYPGRVAAGSVCETTVSFCDFIATLDEMLGTQHLAESPNAAPDSFSFLADLLGQSKTSPSRPNLVLKSGRGLMTIRKGPWKLIEGDGSGGFSDRGKKRSDPKNVRGQLYHLKNDPGEQVNLIEKHPEIVKSLRAELKEVTQATSSDQDQSR
ncbi:MAG: arylsulfatase [Planctomycetota bacterium]